MDGAGDELPRPLALSPSLVRFISETFRSREDLSRSASIESDLATRCANFEVFLSDLNGRISDTVHSYAVRSEEAVSALGGFREGLVGLRSRVSSPDSDGGEGDVRSEKFLAEELLALAKEVARVETVRAYAETALKLDSLIGDVEDAVSSSVTSKLRSLTIQLLRRKLDV